MAVFESRYRPNMEVIAFVLSYFSVWLFVYLCCMQVDEAKQLVRDAIAGGIFNDLVIVVTLHVVWKKTLEGAGIAEFGEKSSNYQFFNHHYFTKY